MATSKGGRPRKHAKGTGTNQVRVDDDLAQMIGWICEVKGVSTANLISPMLQEPIRAMYEELYPLIKKVKEVQDQLATVKGQEPGPPLPDFDIHLEDGDVTSLWELHLTQEELDKINQDSRRMLENRRASIKKPRKK